MNKLKFSTIYMALAAVGMAGSATALECSATRHYSTTDENLNQCTTVFNGSTNNNTWLSTSDNSLSITGSNLSVNSEDEEQYAELIYAKNAKLSISKSTLSADIGTGELLRLQDTTANIQDSTLNINTPNPDDFTDLIIAENSTVTINNSTLSGTGETAAIAFSEPNNKVTLNNTTVTTDLVLNTWWDADNSIEYAGLDLSINDSTINHSRFFSVATSYDDEEAITNIETLNITANNSTLSGVISMPDKVSDSSTYSLTLNNSSWTTAPQDYTDSETNQTQRFTNKLTNLALNNGKVNLTKVDGFQTVTLGNLSGNGDFSLNTDLATQQSDKITVTGSDSGSFGLAVNDSGNEPQAPNGKVTLIETQTGTANFSLLGRDYVDAGAYRYRLAKDGTNWILTNTELADQTKTTSKSQPDPVAPIAGNTTSNSDVNIAQNSAAYLALSEKSNALVSLRQAQLLQLEQSMNGIHQRLGEQKGTETGNVWVRNLNTRNKFDRTHTASNSRTSGFNQNLHSLEVGADFAASERIRLGGFIGNARSNVDFNGEYGSGKVKNQTIGIYGTFLADNGFYWDNIAKYARVKSESSTTGERRYNGYMLSGEIGRHHSLGSGWTITPQLQLAWSHLSGETDEDSISSLYGRAGVRVAKAIDLTDWSLQPYAEINGVKTKNSAANVRVNQHELQVNEVASSRSRFEGTLGLNAKINNHRLGIEAKTSDGKRLNQPFVIQATYRYQW